MPIFVRELVKRKPVTVRLGESGRRAAEIMVRENIGFLPIVSPEDERRVVGVVSERDYVKAISRGLNPLEVRVEDMGTMGRFYSVHMDAHISEAAKLMNKHGIRHLVVVDDEGLLVGVVSIRDILNLEGLLSIMSEYS